MTTLAYLCRRAASMYGPPADGATLTSSVAAVQQLSLFAVALSSLAGGSRDASSYREDVTLAASTCARQLLRHVSALPASADVSEKVMSSVFATAKQHQHFLDTPTTYELVRETSSRFSTVHLLTWKPKQLLAGLHAIAKSCGAQPLPITEELIAHIERALPQLNARDTALFLWCLAVLHWFDRNPSLWDTACRRCILLLSQMNPVSRATVLHAVLLTPAQCESRAQQELMALLQQDQDQSLSSAPSHGVDNESDRGAGDHKGLRLRLLTSVARLPTDVQLTLLQRLCRQASPARKEQSHATLSSPDFEELAYLFEHLSRKSLSLPHALTVLELFSETSQSAGFDTVSLLPGAQRVWRNAITVVAPLDQGYRGESASFSPGRSPLRDRPAAVPLSGSESTDQRCLKLLVAAGLGIPSLLAGADASTPGRRDAPPSLLSLEESRQLCRAVAAQLLAHVERWQHALAPASAQAVWLAALATDFVSGASALLRVDAPTDALRAARRAVDAYPILWEQRGTAAREGVALVALAQSTPPMPAWAAGDSPSTTRAVLSRSVAALLASTREVHTATVAGIGARPVLELCIAVEVGGQATWLASDEATALSGLWPRLLHAQQAHTPLLRAMTELIQARTRAAGMGGARIPDALLEVWIRHLQGEGESALSPAQEAALLSCFAQRAADADALERAFLLLVTRRLGESRTLLDTRRLSPSGVVCLAEHACTLAKWHAVTASTILFSLMQRLATEAREAELTLDALNDVASLLSSPACEDRETRDALASAVKHGAVKLLTTRPWPAESKAYLVAYLVRAEVTLEPPFLTALRALPSTA